jgi:membrane-associated phospholipid phosphatase
MNRPNVPPSRGLALAFAIVLVVVVLLLGVAVRGAPAPIDVGLADTVASLMPPPATDLFNFLGTLPVFIGVGVVGAAVQWLRGRQSIAVAFLLGLGAEFLTTLVKVAVDRQRPPGGTDVEGFITAASYPSGHSVRLVVMTGLLVVALAPREGAGRWLAIAGAVLLVVLVGCARIASHEHWPTDVLGGWLLGTAWLTVCLLVERTLRTRNVARGRSPS